LHFWGEEGGGVNGRGKENGEEGNEGKKSGSKRKGEGDI